MTKARPESDVVDVTKWTHERLDWHLRICCDGRLRDRAKLLASLLLHDFDLRKGGCAWRGQDGENSLSARAGWKEPRTVQLAAQELEAAGYLRIERGKGRGKSNRYFPVFEAPEPAAAEPENTHPDTPFAEPENTHPDTPFEAEKAHLDPGKGVPTYAQHRKDSSSSLSAMRARETAFDDLVEGCPAGMLAFVDLPAARETFEGLLDRGEATAEVLGARLAGFAASEAFRTRKHPPQLHDWLRKGMWRARLDAAPAEAAKPAAATAFDGPPEVAAALRELGGRTVDKFLIGATWREADRTIETVSGWGRDELVKACGKRSLGEMAIKVVRRGEG